MFDKIQLTNILEQLRQENKIAGMAVAVTDREKVIYSEGFGFDSAIRPDVRAYHDAMYKIASVTKTVVAFMVMRLAEQGVLELDKPIIHYIPWLTLSNPESAQKITLWHLLTHTAGLPGDFYMEEGSRDEATIDEVVKATLPTFENLPPCGERFMYSTWGYNLIGTVASAVTGKTISELLDEYVLKPLGMQTTTFDYHVASTYPLSLPHVKTQDGGFKVIHHQRVNTVYSAGGGLYSSASDMCAMLRFIMNDAHTDSGEQLLTRASLEKMLGKYNRRTNRPQCFYGAALMQEEYDGGWICGHTGNYDPYNCSVFADRKKGYGIVVLANTDMSEARYEIPKIILKMLP